MKTSIYGFWLLPLVPSIVLTTPSLGYGNDGCCLTDSQAIRIADTWCSLNVVFDEALSNATLAEDFQLFSDSENWAASPPPNAPV